MLWRWWSVMEVSEEWGGRFPRYLASHAATCTAHYTAHCCTALPTTLHYTVLYCTNVHCVVLYSSALHCTALLYTMLHCTTLY